MKTAIVVTGLPASGKSTIARAVAKALALEIHDKDIALEALFDHHPVRNPADRTALSRRSDDIFQAVAKAGGSAVLVSHWRTPGLDAPHGTPVAWLADSYDRLVELCCQCRPEIATARFRARSRHPGHLDATRDAAELARWLESLSDAYPLGVGRWVSVHTDAAVDVDHLLARLLDVLDTPDSGA